MFRVRAGNPAARRARLLAAAVPFLFASLSDAAGAGAFPARGGTVRVPPGFHVDVSSAEVPGARSIALGERGTVFVGTRREGKVCAVQDRNGDGGAERVVTIVRGLDMPNGVAFRDGSVYAAEVSRVIRLEGIEARPEDRGPPAVVDDSFPRDAIRDGEPEERTPGN